MDFFAENLKISRKNNNMTQAEVAKLLGINRVTYTGYESGKHKPDPETIVKIADIFKVSTDYLLGRYKN